MSDIFTEIHLPRIEAEGYEYIKTIPEIEALLSAEVFEEIRLIKHNIVTALPYIMLEFTVTAPSLMPHPRQGLLDQGLVKRHNLSSSEPLANGGLAQKLGFFEHKLQVNLEFQPEGPAEDKPQTINAHRSRHHRSEDTRDQEELRPDELGLLTIRLADAELEAVIYLKRGSQYYPCMVTKQGETLGLELIEETPASGGGRQLPIGDFLPMQMFDPNSLEFYIKA